MRAPRQFSSGTTTHEPKDVLVEQFLNLLGFKISIRVGLVAEWLSL
jgi:hypothetical protein